MLTLLYIYFGIESNVNGSKLIRVSEKDFSQANPLASLLAQKKHQRNTFKTHNNNLVDHKKITQNETQKQKQKKGKTKINPQNTKAIKCNNKY